MIRRNLSISILGLALFFCGCSAKEQTYWEKKKGTVIVHHVRRTYNGTRDRTESLTANTVTPAEIHVYDLGRMPDGNGGMHEAHATIGWFRAKALICDCLPRVARD
jgi:hypothetical protein